MMLSVECSCRTQTLSVNTVDQEIFTEVYFCVLNFSAFNFRHLASLYIVAIARKNFSRV